MSLQKEIERHKIFLEENPPLKEDGGWLCPKCDNCHRTEDDAIECCMPDEQDMDCQRYHNGREA